ALQPSDPDVGLRSREIHGCNRNDPCASSTIGLTPSVEKRNLVAAPRTTLIGYYLQRQHKVRS
ncbi:MAG: hypothetical protein WAZ97_11005, partial [Pseudolabrys sp.]